MRTLLEHHLWKSAGAHKKEPLDGKVCVFAYLVVSFLSSSVRCWSDLDYNRKPAIGKVNAALVKGLFPGLASEKKPPSVRAAVENTPKPIECLCAQPEFELKARTRLQPTHPPLFIPIRHEHTYTHD
jgi:hypothetical protein